MIRYQLVRIMRKFFYPKEQVDELLTDKSSIEIQKSQVVDFPSSIPMASHTHQTSDITNFPSTMTPASHSHGNLQNDGQVGSSIQANKNVVTNSNGKITTEDKYSHPTHTAVNGVPTSNINLTFGGSFQVSQPIINNLGHVTQLNPRTLSLPTLPIASTNQKGIIQIGSDSNSAAAGNHSHNANNILFTPTVEEWQGIGNPSNVSAALNNSFEYTVDLIDSKQEALTISHQIVDSNDTPNGRVEFFKYGQLVIATFRFKTTPSRTDHHLVNIPNTMTLADDVSVLPSVSCVNVGNDSETKVYISFENGVYQMRCEFNKKNTNTWVRGQLIWLTE